MCRRNIRAIWAVTTGVFPIAMSVVTGVPGISSGIGIVMTGISMKCAVMFVRSAIRRLWKLSLIHI